MQTAKVSVSVRNVTLRFMRCEGIFYFCSNNDSTYGSEP